MRDENTPVRFVKMHGAGNDFVVIDNRSLALSADQLSEHAQSWCHRKRGIGADGVLALGEPEGEHHDVKMIYHNADGSRATMCGNGARCLARFARLRGIDSQPLVMETDAGTYRASVPADLDASVKLWVPAPKRMALSDLSEGKYILHYVWTGTHHVVVMVDDVSSVDAESIGRRWRNHERYQPEGTNVNFVEVTGPASLSVRTFEKGVEEETLACGTGAIAAAVIARELAAVESNHIRVKTRGGKLLVGLGDDYFLEGPAEISFRGEVDP